jgi:glycosyltransferase involved in cell wall biosynthesis
MTKGVSIVLCTYNGKNRLATTFEHLNAQQLNIPCELIFVDNASNDGTIDFADDWWNKNKSSHISYRSFQQPIPGKSYAQDLGYEKARYEYLLVCDDDNWLCNTYVQTAFDIMEKNKMIGALGGWCEGVFETDEPDWFDNYTKYYVVVKQGDKSGDITHKKGCLYGAGMMVRKSHWLQLKTLGFEHLLSCRKGDSLSSGGDTEYSYALRLLGYKIWYDERLYFKHFMASGRLNLNYVSRLRKALADSNFTLWPYKDILNNKKRSRIDFYKMALKTIPTELFKHLLYLNFGTFDKNENAKDYFRYLNRQLFLYSFYEKNWQIVNSWYQKSKTKPN